MSQPLTQFWPIFPCKSDGHDVVNQKGAILRNGPTQEQLDRTPNEQGQCDYYRLIEREDPKHIDWRKKLGGMLLREIGGKQNEDKWQQCILWDFPENYRLYEHIKTKADGQSKPVKNHSGGGHDRQDAYLYGYPKGPRKRFRSPIEFFPHLLWLCTDETSDYQNCSCKMCSPMQIDVDKPQPKPEIRPDVAANAVRKENSPHILAAVQTAPPVQAVAQDPGPRRSPIVQVPMQRSASGPPTTQSPAPKPATPIASANGQHIKAPTPMQSTPLPPPRTIEQQVDHQYGKFLARTGEVVWFYRPKTSAWGLGLVVRRWIDGTGNRAYVIQPLSHPYEAPPQEVVTSDQHLKPWLAWSAPACTYPYLQQNPNLTYEQVDWTALLSGQFGNGIADVDASILASKAIDKTYTLFDLLSTTNNIGTEERHWNCLYLGAEKIWRGEPVRLRIGSGTDLMVITGIVERTVGVTPQNQANSQSLSKVQVIGDIYAYATLPVQDPSNPPESPQQNPNIPVRMREDMRWRNQILVPNSRTFAYWKLIAPNSRLEISEIKGRWYETSLVFVDSFEKAVKSNEGGNGIWMNSRGDANGVGRTAGIARPDRVAAFGNAVPKGLRLIDSIEPQQQSQQPQQPQPQQQPLQQQHQHQQHPQQHPQQQQHAQQQQHRQSQTHPQQHAHQQLTTSQQPTTGMQAMDMALATHNTDTGFALDDFMNLDGMEDNGMHFGDGGFHF